MVSKSVSHAYICMCVCIVHTVDRKSTPFATTAGRPVLEYY